jgi:hypothetical protein
MKKFIIKCFVFSLPIFLFFAPPVLVLKITGENYSDIENIIVNKAKYLIGYAYNESNYLYLKWKEVHARGKRDIISLGSSRVLQFRKNMFETSFYNAGFTISRISDFVPFLKDMPPNKYPKILLITLDQWMFNENWDSLSKKKTKTPNWENSFNRNASINTLLSVWSDLISGKYGIGMLYEIKRSKNMIKVGLNSIVNSNGFRNDGSFYYGELIVKLINKDPSAIDYNYNDTYSRIKRGKRRFQYGSEVNQRALNELDKLLSFCHQYNIYVVAILPPFANKVNERLRSTENYSYMYSINKEAKPLFEKYDFELWDMTFLNKFNSGDNETLDGFHGGEVSYIKMLIFLIENDSILKRYTNLDLLKSDLENRLNRFIVYDY